MFKKHYEISDSIMSILGKARRKLFILYRNIVDFYDSFLAPNLLEKTTPFGFRFAGKNSIHHKAMQKGEFEPNEIKWLIEKLSKVDLFVDIGANIGYFTCLARHHGKTVISVEPHHSNLQLLLKNIELNQGSAVEVLPVALGDSISVLKLYGASSTGASLLPNWAGSSSIFSSLVPVTTLDNILSGRYAKSQLLIKIDVEGFEYQLLLGGTQTLHRSIKPIWLIEITNSQFHPRGNNPHFKNTFELFWTQHYECYALASNGVISIPTRDYKQISEHQKNGLINYIFIDKNNLEI